MDFSYNAIRERIINNLRAKASWANILPWSTNTRLIDAVSKELAEVARYGEYGLQETKWELAQNKSSLVTEATVRGYRPHRKIGATGSVWVSTKEYAFADYYNSLLTYEEGDYVRTQDNTVYKAKQDVPTSTVPPNDTYWSQVSAVHQCIVGIPKYTQFKTENDLFFTAIESTDLLTSENYTEVNTVQGTPETYTTIAQGDRFEEIEIVNDSIEENYYEVYVNGEKYSEVLDIRTAEEDDKVFQVKNKFDFSGVIIVFGNDITGRKLNSGDSVTFRYIVTNGALGDSPSQGAVNIVVSTLYDSQSNAVDAYCWSPEGITGGKDEEEIESIRTNGTQSFQAGENVVGKAEYEVKIREFDFIQEVVVWGAYEQNKDEGVDLWTWIPTQENLVYISAYTPGSTPTQLSESQKIDIIKDLSDRKPPEDIIIFKDANFINMKFNIDAKIKNSGYLLNEAEATIETEVWDEYNISNISFEQDLYETDFKSFIHNLDPIFYHTTYVEFFVEGDFSDSSYLFTDTLDMIPVEEETVEVYVKNTTVDGADWVLIGQDEGDLSGNNVGNINGESGYDLTGSSVNYETGDITVNVSSGLTENYEDYSVRVYYQTSNNNLVLQGRNDVFYLKEIDVTATYAD